MRLLSLAFAIMAAVMLANTVSPRAELQLPPRGYAFVEAPGCERPMRQHLIYNVCADQMALMLTARAEAFGLRKQLLVVFGASWCPSCKSLKAVMATPAFNDRVVGGQALKDRVHVVEIAVSMLHLGRVSAVPSGEAVLASVMAQRADVKQRGVPFIAVIDPVSGKTSLRNLDDLEQSRGWNVEAVASVVQMAAMETSGGAKAPAEPGWLTRKWQRWFAN